MANLDMQPDLPEQEDYGFTVNLLRSTISKYFIVNDVRSDRQAFAFFVQVDERTLEDSFDDMRRELLDLGYVPNLLKERPGYVVYVVRMPERQFRGTNVNAIMLVLTVLSTIAAGMMFVMSYEELPFFSWETAGKGALYFALPLMLILGLHEMGHYLAARRHRVAASLPFFIPAPPPIFFIGTLGAFISLREPIQSKRSLMDIGFAGPIAGFVVAIFVTVLGFKLSLWNPIYADPDESATILLGTPLIFDAIAYLVPTPDNVLIHPTAFAGWVGFLVTFLNLLPAGQLDGGHIFRALFGQYAKYMGYATIIAMIFISYVTGYYGWAIFIVFIILFLNHPPPLNDISPLPPSRYVVGVAAVLMLLVCFVPAPFALPDLEPGIDPSFEEPDVYVLPGEWVNNTLLIYNTGNTKLEGQIRVPDTGGWQLKFDERVKFKSGLGEWSEPFDINKDPTNNYTKRINLTMSPGPTMELGNRTDLLVEVKYIDPNDSEGNLFARFRATVGWIEPVEAPSGDNIPLDQVNNYKVRLKNLFTHPENGTTRFNLSLQANGSLSYTLTGSDVTNMTPEDVNSTPPLDHVVLANNGTAELRVWVYAAPDAPQTPGVQVNLTVGMDGEPATLTTIGFVLNVGTVVYEVSLSPTDLQWSFVQGARKNVTFNLANRGNVVTELAITYNLTGDDAFDIDGTTALALAPGEERVLPVEVLAKGEEDDSAILRVEIAYGNLQTASASTVLEISVMPI